MFTCILYLGHRTLNRKKLVSLPDAKREHSHQATRQIKPTALPPWLFPTTSSEHPPLASSQSISTIIGCGPTLRSSSSRLLQAPARRDLHDSSLLDLLASVPKYRTYLSMSRTTPQQPSAPLVPQPTDPCMYS